MASENVETFRSRSPHMRRHSPHRPVSPNEKKALWRRRREAAEADDYRERLSPNRQRAISPSLSPNRDRKDSWAAEDEQDNDEWLGRAERALGGLNRYEQEFKRYTPDAMEKENQNPRFSAKAPSTPIGASGKPIRPRSVSPKPVDIEKDVDVLMRRQKDIDYGKNTENYQQYITDVPKRERLDMQPWTPDKYEKMTRRNWDKQVKIWRKQLHYWREPKPVTELMTPGTSPCPSPHRNRSPEREPQPSTSARALFVEDDECAMDSFANQQTQQPILSQAALNLIQREGSFNMEDDNSNSRMSCDAPDEPMLPAAFKKN